jgi:hypothetical protein
MAVTDIYDLLEQQFGARVEPILDFPLAQLTNVSQVLFRQDPRVAGWSFVNTGAAAVALRPMGVASAANGIQVPPSGMLSVNWRDDGVLPALEWQAVSPGGNQTFFAIAYRIVPQGGG